MQSFTSSPVVAYYSAKRLAMRDMAVVLPRTLLCMVMDAAWRDGALATRLHVRLHYTYAAHAPDSPHLYQWPRTVVRNFRAYVSCPLQGRLSQSRDKLCVRLHGTYYRYCSIVFSVRDVGLSSSSSSS